MQRNTTNLFYEVLFIYTYSSDIELNILPVHRNSVL